MKNSKTNLKLWKVFLTLGTLLISITAFGADFDLGSYGVLSIDVPDEWVVNDKAINNSEGDPLGYAFAFKPRSGANAKCLLTFAWVGNERPDKPIIKKELIKSCEMFLSQSVEKKINLKYFSPKTGCGAYCILTDASLVGKKVKTGEYKVMGSGQIQPGNYMLGIVSIFADDAKSKEFKAMIEIINSLKVSTSAKKIKAKNVK